ERDGWRIVAAAAGGINSRVIYGARRDGIAYHRIGANEEHYFRDACQNSERLMPAAYTVSSRPGRVAAALLTAIGQFSGLVIKPTNDGGGLYPLIVASGEPDRYTVAAELCPAPLYELTTGFMALLAKATVRRMNGEPLVLDPNIKQTMLVARTPQLAQQYINLMRPLYGKKIAYFIGLMRLLYEKKRAERANREPLRHVEALREVA
ncbi:hypothetical protein D6833_02405, partial [Candidatus Parcubacteria bacterium]